MASLLTARYVENWDYPSAAGLTVESGNLSLACCRQWGHLGRGTGIAGRPAMRNLAKVSIAGHRLRTRFSKLRRARTLVLSLRIMSSAFHGASEFPQLAITFSNVVLVHVICALDLGSVHAAWTGGYPYPESCIPILTPASSPLILHKSRMRRCARTDPSGGCSVMNVPTGTNALRSAAHSAICNSREATCQAFRSSLATSPPTEAIP